MTSMTEQIGKTHRRQKQVLQWIRRDYPATRGPNVESYILEIDPRGYMNRVIRSVCTPGEASKLCREHNDER